MATLDLCITKGTNLKHEHGLPGSLVSTVSYHPLKFADKNLKKELLNCDPSAKSTYHIGETESSAVTSSPVWVQMLLSDDVQRLKQLLPSTNFLSRTYSNAEDLAHESLASRKDTESSSLQYPLLQQIKSSNVSENDIELIPWKDATGAIIIQIRFSDVLNKLPLFDQILGEVTIPLSRLAEKKEIEGWFKVEQKGTTQSIEDSVHHEVDEEGEHTKSDNENDQQFMNNSTDSAHPQIYIKVKLSIPSSSSTDIDRETSVVVTEQMVRSANLGENKGIGFIGTSINTFNTVRGVSGNVQYLQNQLGSTLDMIEMVQNAFNFAVSVISISEETKNVHSFRHFL